MEKPDYLPEPREAWESCDPDGAFVRHVGPVWRRRTPEGFDHCLIVQPHHGNMFSNMHGGMIATVADHALGYTALMVNEGRRMVTVSLTVNYVTGGKIGDLLVCRAEVVRRARSVCFLRGDIMCGDRVVATANGVWKSLGD